MELLVSPYGNHVAGAHEDGILHKYTRQGLVSSAAGKLSLGLTLERQLLQVAEKRTVQSVCLSPLKPDHEASETSDCRARSAQGLGPETLPKSG